MAKIDRILQIIKEAEATDLHLVAGSVPMVRVNGQLEKTRHRQLADEDIRQLVYELLGDEQIRTFEKSGDLDLAYGIPGVARFRFNIYRTFTGVAAAIRLIPDQILDLAELGFPDSVRQIVESKSGLVLVAGPTNSGKTTTLAAMIDHINTISSRHIITLEDPIEYLHTNKNSLVSQRQTGFHAASFAAGLRAALREDPDVVMVGEMRDIETISLAVSAAEAGILVMGTMHTCTAPATIDRIIEIYPANQQQQIRIMLADSLNGVVCQQLVRRAEGGGRVVACEVLTRSSSISALIRERKSHEIPAAMQTGRKYGMQLLDQHLSKLVGSGIITAAEAAKVATDPTRFQTPSSSKKQPQMVSA
jgi:twitching motility protein PilT